MPKDNMERKAAITAGTMAKMHNLISANIVFFEYGAFNKYKENNDIVGRFRLQDGILNMKLADIALLNWIPDSELFLTEDRFDLCDSCSRINDPLKPLHWSTFNPIEDWLTDVPLETDFSGELN